MTTKLASYNAALGHLEQGRLASLAENREPRRVLDDYWDKAVRYCLERKNWNFAYRSAEIGPEDTNGPRFGYRNAFKIPDDRLRTRKISAAETFDPPLLQFAEEAGYWFANVALLYVQYNSSDPHYGMNLGAWPESFANYVELRLARLACKRITGSSDLLDGPRGLIKLEDRACTVAASLCALNEPVGFRSEGLWTRSRRGEAGGRGDAPGGSLIG